MFNGSMNTHIRKRFIIIMELLFYVKLASKMPEYVVKIKAELENIQRLIPIPNNLWKMNVASPIIFL